MIKLIIKNLLIILFYPLKYFIPKGKIIILGTNSPYHYSGNTRYLYEYLSSNIDADIFWHTECDNVKNYLKSMGMRYISNSNPISFVWILLRAKVVVNDGDAYVNTFKIIDNIFTSKINTGHGSNAKYALYNFKGIISIKEQISRLQKFNYINVASSYITKSFIDLYLVNNKQMISYGYPRCDQFFNKELVKKKYLKKSIARSLNSKIDENTRIILYTPTWRPYKYSLPILDIPDFDAEDFNDYLDRNNYYFFYTVHSGNKPNLFLKNYSRIKFIDRKDYPLFDINSFMIESDILLNDYSATTTDYSLLDKAQLFCMPDYDYYWGHKSMKFMRDGDSDQSLTGYRESIPGDEVHDYNAFKDKLNYIIGNYSSYINQYEDKKNIILSKYYDIQKSDSCARFKNLLEKILCP